jgi:enoyl-CoA hydratase/carnithine racemase
MAHEDKGHLEVEDRGAVLIVRVDGGPHSLFGLDIANQLEELVDRVDRDPSVHAVVFTGAHPERFVSHADVRWLQEGGAAVPSLGRRGASAVVRVARSADRARVLEPMVRRTPLRGAVELDRLHATFLRMNGSGVIFVAALNGSARSSPGCAIYASWLMETSSSASRRCSWESCRAGAAPSD